MNYKNLRRKSKLDLYTIANLLGIDKNIYKEIEEGKKNLSGELIDKFCEIVDNAKIIKIENKQKERDIDEWLKSGQATKDMYDMGYNYNTLSEAIGCAQPTVNQIMNNKRKGSFGLKNTMYEFLKEPLNKNIKENKKKDDIEILYVPPKEHKGNDKELEKLKAENERLKKQLERYEKLIDML